MALNEDDSTMTSSSQWTFVIGRVGTINHLINRSDLNESLGRIVGYAGDSNRYHVRCRDGKTISIKVENITLVDDIGSPDYVTELRQNPMLVAENLGPDAVMQGVVTPGAVVYLGDGASLIWPQFMITQPCLVRGGENCVVSSSCVVDLKCSQRVEFENIKFSTSAGNAVLVLSGSHTIFKNCIFTADDASFASDFNSTAYFDSCIFERARGSGTICAGNQFMRNCIIRHVGGFGVEVRDHGVLKAWKCQIVDTGRAGVIGYKDADTMELSDCHISRSRDSGVLLLDGCTGTLRHCDIRDAKVAGVAIQNRGTACIDACTIASCWHGVLAQTGKCSVLVKSCSISKCKMYGIFIGMDCRGTVTLLENTLTKNKVKAINNDAVEEHCTVMVDGRILTNKQGTMAQVDPASRDSIIQATDAACAHMFNSAQATLKARAKVGLATITCASCCAAQGDVKFLTCGQCLEMRYCSKQCQKMHWKNGHKQSCVKRIKYASLLHPDVAI